MQLITHKSVSSPQNYSDKSDRFQTPGWVSALFVKLPQTSEMIRKEKKKNSLWRYIKGFYSLISKQVRVWQFNLRPLEVAVTPNSFDFLKWGSNLHFVRLRTLSTVTELEDAAAAHEHIIRRLYGLRSVETAETRTESRLLTLAASESLVLAISSNSRCSWLRRLCVWQPVVFLFLFFFSLRLTEFELMSR